jgi:(S)-ureidoglycine aminohydrolase
MIAVVSELPACFTTRGASRRDYHLIAPENQAPSVLPELAGTGVVKLVTPRRAPAAFAQYLLEIDPGGGSAVARAAIDERFEHCFYGLAGGAVLSAGGAQHTLVGGRFAYVHAGVPITLDNPAGAGPARVLWFKRLYVPVHGLGAPECVFGDRAAMAEPEYQPGLYRTVLFGDGDPRFDFAVIRMRFEPGTDLAMTELHDEEHGLYMTAGRGTYLLGENVHEVAEGDFIYIAPYCPQSFVADPRVGAEYLLYKDVCRDGWS